MKNQNLSFAIFLVLMGLCLSTLGFPGGPPAYVTSVRTLFSPTPVGTASPVPLITSLPSNCSEIDVFDSSGQTFELMQGAAGSETRVRLIYPGGTGRVPQWLPQGARISLRALSAAASSGEDDFTCLAE